LLASAQKNCLYHRPDRRMQADEYLPRTLKSNFLVDRRMRFEARRTWLNATIHNIIIVVVICYCFITLRRLLASKMRYAIDAQRRLLRRSAAILYTTRWRDVYAHNNMTRTMSSIVNNNCKPIVSGLCVYAVIASSCTNSVS